MFHAIVLSDSSSLSSVQKLDVFSLGKLNFLLPANRNRKSAIQYDSTKRIATAFFLTEFYIPTNMIEKRMHQDITLYRLRLRP